MFSLSLTDVIILAVILIYAIVGMAKGFIKAIFSKLCWILGIFGAILFYKRLSVHMTALVHNQTVSLILCFLLIFVVIFLIVKIVQIVIERIFDGEIMKGLDRALGFFFGILEGLVVIFIILFILTLQPWFDVSKLFEGSLIYNFLIPFVQKSQDSIPQVTGEIALSGFLNNSFFAG